MRISLVVALAIWILHTDSTVSFSLPKITLTELTELNDANELMEKMKDDGGKISAFEVTDIGYRQNLTEFKVLAPECIGGNDELPEIELDDGSKRVTFATTDPDVFPACMGNTMNPLTNAFERIENGVNRIISLLLNGQSLSFSSKTNGVRLTLDLEDSPVKDHVHVYFKRNVTKTGHKLVPYHIDNGIFLIITPFTGQGLMLKTSANSEVSTDEVGEDSIIVLMCRGLTDWFLQSHKAGRRKFFAVPHSVPGFPDKSTNTRSVYARMKVVPMDALPGINGATRGKKIFKYIFENSDQHRSQNEICSVDLSNEDKKEERSSWLRMMDKQCGAGEAYCWMSCRPFNSKCSTLESSICYSTLRNLSCSTQINGLPMDQSCQWECKNDIFPSNARKTLDPTPNKYCNGKMDMYMTGFEVQGKAGGVNPCIILFFEAWTLDSKLKFVFGCVGVFFIGLVIEAIISFRRSISGRKTRFYISRLSRRSRKFVLVGCFGINLALGYLAMLVAMTYSVELFCSVIFGLIVGHAVFNVNSGVVTDSIDPCCAGNENFPRESLGGDTYPFNRAPCEDAMPSILNNRSSDGDSASVPCGSERESFLDEPSAQQNLVA